MPTSFFYPIITQQDVCHTLEGFEPYPEECGIPLPDFSSLDDKRNIQCLRRYWRNVDTFVREEYAGWKVRQEELRRMQGGSEGVWKRGRKEVSELEDEVESPSKKKRTISDFVIT